MEGREPGGSAGRGGNPPPDPARLSGASPSRRAAIRYDPETSVTTFDDVAGAAGAKRELKEIVMFLEDPPRFHRLGTQVPKGVLLVGPPGTGKTLLARAVAGEAGVPFFIITGSDFMEMFVGVGAKRVRDLFEKAKAAAPSIVFIDELDSVGRHRGAGLGGGHDEREQTLNQHLSALDGLGEQLSRPKDHSEATAEAVDREVRRILDEAAARATEILRDRRDQLDRIADVLVEDVLVEKEEMTGSEVLAILEGSAEAGVAP